MLTAAVLLFSLAALPSSLAHSWNEQIALVSQNGTFVGPRGYPRGYVARTDPGYNGHSMMYLLPPDGSGRTRINSTDLLCHPAQRTQNQTAKYPRLQASPSSWISTLQLENGHVTLPQNQPGKQKGAGTVFVFGTTKPSSTETLENVLKWTSDGTGGDKNGKLLVANNFDDGQCHQINSGAISVQRQQEFPDPKPDQPTSKDELWCQTSIQIPANAPTGQPYTLYWIWDWPTMPGADPSLLEGKSEYYTTCSDIDIVASPAGGPTTNTLLQQDPMPSAVPDYLSRTAYITSPPPDDGLPAASSSTPAGAPAATAASSAATTPAAAADPTAIVAGTATASPSLLTATAVSPLPLSMFTPAASPAPASASSSSYVVVTTTVDTPPPTQAPTVLTLTVSPGVPVFMVEGNQIRTLAKRVKRTEVAEVLVASVTQEGAATVATAVPKATPTAEPPAVLHHPFGRYHRVAHLRRWG